MHDTDPMTGWPFPYGEAEHANTRSMLIQACKQLLARSDMPLWALSQRVFYTVRDLPECPQILRDEASVQRKLDIVARAAAEAGAEQVLSLDSKHKWW